MRSRFERYHPIVIFLYYVGAVSLLLLMLHPIFLCIGMVILICLNYSHDRLNGLRRWFFLLIASVFIMVIMNPLFNERGRHVLFVIGDHRFTLEAFVYSGMNALSIIGVIAIFISYNVIMTPNKLLFLFSKFLPQIAVLLMLTLRFIPLMRRRVTEISLIQRSKGISVLGGKWKSKVKNAMQYVQILLTYSLEEAIQTADSMRARGYGNSARTTYEFFRIRWLDTFAIIYLGVLLIISFTGRIFGYGNLTIYPIMESWHLYSADGLLLLCFIMFLSFPIFVEAGGWFRWRISN